MPPEPNTSVDQIFDALRLLVASGQPLGVAEVARELGVPTSTAHRLLATVNEAGYVDRDSTGTKYELGTRAYAVVHALFGRFRIQRTALPVLGRLTTQLGETTLLDVRVGWLAVRMAGLEGWKEIHAGTRIGQAMPLGESASGIAILAHLPEAQVDGYLRWEGGGRRSGTRTRRLRTELEHARAQGYARIAEPGGDGAELALPIRAENVAMAAVCIDGNGPVVDERPRAADLNRVRRAVDGIEREVARNPSLAADPFEHLDDDVLTLAAR